MSESDKIHNFKVKKNNNGSWGTRQSKMTKDKRLSSNNAELVIHCSIILPNK